MVALLGRKQSLEAEGFRGSRLQPLAVTESSWDPLYRLLLMVGQFLSVLTDCPRSQFCNK